MSNQRDPADAFDIAPEQVSDRSDTSPTPGEDTLTIEPEEFDPAAPAPGEGSVRGDGKGQVLIRLPTPEASAPRVVPEWARGKVPKDLVFPRGIFAYFVRIKAHLTHAKHRGDRVLILWELTEGDEKLAYGRSMQDPSRAVAELAKQMIRAFDGAVVNYSGTGAGNVDQLWRELGPKGRNMITILHSRICVMQPEDLRDFFENSIGAVSTA